MTETDPFRSTAAHEARLRRAVRNAGYELSRSRWRAGTIDNIGGFMIRDPARNTVVWGNGWDLTPADVEVWLAD